MLLNPCSRRAHPSIRPPALTTILSTNLVAHFAKFVKPEFLIPHWKIQTGDRVCVISGDDRGFVGTVKECSHARNSLKVQGCKLQKVRDSAQNEKFLEKFIHYSNVMLMDPLLKVPTRTAIKFVDGEMLRVSKKSGAVIPFPDRKEGVKDFSNAPLGPKDTAPEVALQRTYDYGQDVAHMKLIRSRMKKYNHDLH